MIRRRWLLTDWEKSGYFSIAQNAALALIINVLFLGAGAYATDPYSTIQSTARPFGLNMVEKVSRWDADAASQQFHQNQVPLLRDMALQNLRVSRDAANRVLANLYST
ncbi:MAG: hypothetical protein H8F28_26050 [Fibrella sp.]|nr:hypothetical protein [Armatimonadota bacterium]